MKTNIQNTSARPIENKVICLIFLGNTTPCSENEEYSNSPSRCESQCFYSEPNYLPGRPNCMCKPGKSRNLKGLCVRDVDCGK